MGNFSKALQKFADLDSNTAIDHLQDLFAEISKMSVEEVAAAKQTIDFYKTATELNEHQQRLVDALITAICRRAVTHAIAHRHISTRDELFGGAFTSEDLSR